VILISKRIKDVLDKCNRDFSEWLKKALKLDVSTVLEAIITDINWVIMVIHFPVSLTQIKEYSNLDRDSQEDIIYRTITQERIDQMYLLCNLKYDWPKKLSRSHTLLKLDELNLNREVISKFFNYNSVSPNIELKEYEQMSRKYKIYYNILPDLEFDPEFKRIAKSNAIHHLFFKDVPENFLQELETGEYPIEASLLVDALEHLQKEENFADLYGIYLFGSKRLIEEILSLFIEYYGKRNPSYKTEISHNLLCFGELLKASRGKLYWECKWTDLKTLLNIGVPQSFAETFLDEYCFGKQYLPFDNNFDSLRSELTLYEYNDFLKYPCYVYRGKVRSGVFLIWRALIKYLEKLQKLPELSAIKGQLLENWCYYKALKYGFQPEKIILINPEKQPTPNYYKMKEQIKNFPRAPIEIKCEFPGDLNKFYFQEIDLAIKIRNFLFLFEIKRTKAPKGEVSSNVLHWIDSIYRNDKLLEEKLSLIAHNISNKIISHEFFEGVEAFAIEQVKTEGIIGKIKGVELTQGYKKLLKDLAKALEQNEFETLIHERFQKTTIDTDLRLGVKK